MKVLALGLRAIPKVQGGIETHCEHLYPRVARMGVDVEILTRTPYAHTPGKSSWNGVRLRSLWSPRRSGIETFVHTLLGVLYAGVARPDLLHLHAVGPGFFAPLARALGLRVVVTHHGSDYERAKWGPVGRTILKTGERWAMRYANAVISVSASKARQLAAEYSREPIFIPNGVPPIDPPATNAVLDKLGLDPGRYVLHVGRWAPEKRHDDLIRAFIQAGLPGWRLVLVGDHTGQDQYSARVREMAAAHDSVVLAGFQSGDALDSLFTNSGCFALPSTIEGFSIALLESLSAGCRVIASDIPANHEIELPADCYFPVGDIDRIAHALATVAASPSDDEWTELRRKVRADYDWDSIAERTVRVYSHTLGRPLHLATDAAAGTQAGGQADNSPHEQRRAEPLEATRRDATCGQATTAAVAGIPAPAADNKQSEFN